MAPRDGGGRDESGGDAKRPKAIRTDSTDRRIMPCTLRAETGARSQLRLLTTTERPKMWRWEEGGAAVVQ